MTRPKVDPDKRRRTAQACDSCKRRKQKCNGLEPCNTCTKRSLQCFYGVPENNRDDQLSSPKRQKTDHPSNDGAESSPINPNHQSPEDTELQSSQSQWPSAANHPAPQQHQRPQSIDISSVPKDQINPTSAFQNGRHDEPKSSFKAPESNNSGLLSRDSAAPDGPDEEAVVYNSTRMLQDPTGRLLYVGDAATLSFLQLIRMIVDNVVGPTQFTMDPRRHRIVEGTSSLPSNFRRTHLLPDSQTAQVLVDAYFTNTNGLIEIFHRKSFMVTLESCYADPLNVDPSWLCLLHLTFAIGLVMASPVPGTREHAIVQKLRAEPFDRAEVFYQDAKNLSDPSTGFEDAGFWSIQALTLMSVYTLAVSKRNAAYAYHGMAIRSAFALGLHREETMCIFSSAEQSVRRNLWRSLFVLDRFLSASLGRPTAIRERDCSGSSLTTGESPPFPQAPFPTAANADFTNSVGLEASVRSCHVVGVILDKVYSKRKISTRLAQEIADACKGWPKSLDSSLHWRQATSANPNQGIAILHVNLLYCHSIILLCRPFFLFLINKRFQERRDGQRSQKYSTKMERFAEACVIASSHSIALVQNALESRYLPHRNPFVLYFLFASALVVLSNEFAALYHNPTATSSINNSINIMQYCAQQDPQASRLLFILTSFRDVVIRQQATSPLRPSNSLGNHEADDPIGTLLHATAASPKVSSILKHPFIINKPSDLSNSPLPHKIHSPGTNHSGIGSSKVSHSHNHTLSEPSPDTFFDLSRLTNHSHHHSGASTDGNESHNSAGDAEIDFEMLWQWPNSNGTPGIAFTPGGSVGILGGGPAHNTGINVSHVDIQGISDSSVPLYGMSNGGQLGGGV